MYRLARLLRDRRSVGLLGRGGDLRLRQRTGILGDGHVEPHTHQCDLRRADRCSPAQEGVRQLLMRVVTKAVVLGVADVAEVRDRPARPAEEAGVATQPIRAGKGAQLSRERLRWRLAGPKIDYTTRCIAIE